MTAQWMLPGLHDALRAFADAVARLYNDSLQNNPLPDEPIEAYRVAAAFQDVAFSIPEWQDVLAVIHSDSRIQQQVGSWVGSIVGGQVIHARDLGIAFVLQVTYAIHGDNDEDFIIRRSVFDMIYAPIDSFLGSDTIIYDAYSVLVGLKCDSPKIALSEGVSVELLDNEDLRLVELRFSIMSVARDQAERDIGEVHLPEHYRYAFRKVLNLPKLIGQPGDRSGAVEIYDKLSEDRRNCLRSIAAATYCHIRPWPAQIVERSWRGRMLSMTYREPLLVTRYDSPGATLSADSESVMRATWSHLTHPEFKSRHAVVVLALDRLSGLGLRFSQEDQLIDVIVACEAFFLEGGSGELRFRLALNAAMIAPLLFSDWPQHSVFELLKKAYDLRSAIVHGNASRTSIRIGNQTYDINATVYYSAEVIRRAIAYRMLTVKPGGQILYDWESFYFRAATDDAEVENSASRVNGTDCT